MNNLNIYLASPFFTENELEYVAKAETILRNRNFDVYSPREHEIRDKEAGTPEWSKAIFEEDRVAIDKCDVVVLLYHGGYSDSGTAWECGYAYGTGKPVVVVQLGQNSNLMVHEGCRSNLTSVEELTDYDFENMPEYIYTGEMF